MDDDKCPYCGEQTVTWSMQDETVLYGPHPNTVSLDVTVPTGDCSACGFHFTDYRAEKIRAERVDEYLAGSQSRL